MFGQQLEPESIAEAVRIAQSSDIFLAVGSSLQVEPAASMCRVAVDAGAALLIVNAEPTPYDRLATEVFQEPIGEALPRIAAELIAQEGSAAEGAPEAY
jgi:NAD-dependent deacetylase